MVYMYSKTCDDTTEDSFEYDGRNREIASEMFYIMSKVNDSVNKG